MKPKPQMIKCPCGIAGARPGGVTADMIKYPNPLRLEGRKGKWGAKGIGAQGNCWGARELGRKGNWGAKGFGAQRKLKVSGRVAVLLWLVTQRFCFFAPRMGRCEVTFYSPGGDSRVRTRDLRVQGWRVNHCATGVAT